MSLLYRALFYDSSFNTFFEAKSHLEALLEFERNLALAQSLHGVIPVSAAQAIETACQFDRLEIKKLIQESALSGNLFIPLIKQCGALLSDDPSGGHQYIHFGATSQDAVDSALMIQYKKCNQWILFHLHQLIRDLASIADAHRLTPMVGRTFLQQAKPITFGFKIAGWLDGLLQSYQKISGLSFPLQLGGAVGTWSGSDSSSFQKISDTLAQYLNLSNPLKPWHNQRQPIAEIAIAFGILSGHLTKMAKDLSLMAQTEIGEVSFHSPGKGHSSAMPHKNNPVNCILISANGNRIPHLMAGIMDGMATDHERATGAWHAEWETMEDILKLTAGSIRLSLEMIKEIQIHPDRMLENISLTKGLIFAEAVSQNLSLKIGKLKAQALLEKACVESAASGISLLNILSDEKEIRNNITRDELEALFKIENNLGLAEYFTLEVLTKTNRVLNVGF